MKNLFIFILILFIFSSCEKEELVPNHTTYDYMSLERVGGGQIKFDIFPTNDPNKVKVVISEHNFKKVNLEITITNEPNLANSFFAFERALSGEVELTSDFKQSPLPTGSWVHVYFLNKEIKTEVTNPELRDVLLKFEQIIKSKI